MIEHEKTRQYSGMTSRSKDGRVSGGKYNSNDESSSYRHHTSNNSSVSGRSSVRVEMFFDPRNSVLQEYRYAYLTARRYARDLKLTTKTSIYRYILHQCLHILDYIQRHARYMPLTEANRTARLICREQVWAIEQLGRVLFIAKSRTKLTLWMTDYLGTENVPLCVGQPDPPMSAVADIQYLHELSRCYGLLWCRNGTPNPKNCLKVVFSIWEPFALHLSHCPGGGGDGGRAVGLLATYRCDLGSIPGQVTPDFRMWELCGMIPLVSRFSRGSPISPTLSFQCCSILTSITLIGSQDLNVKSLQISSLTLTVHLGRISVFWINCNHSTICQSSCWLTICIMYTKGHSHTISLTSVEPVSRQTASCCLVESPAPGPVHGTLLGHSVMITQGIYVVPLLSASQEEHGLPAHFDPPRETVKMVPPRPLASEVCPGHLGLSTSSMLLLVLVNAAHFGAPKFGQELLALESGQ
ncbi:hypothetical protein PR048_030215 [Dryococelus australis]|uniref:Uncharacterized protein n=1 Tax=Dryococelus australis TaxID=614101 RepID=A0ABQ9GAY5_9NEOP|nr:hypothetical protein PR048_030215 [Dryococelus australis]